MTHKEGLYQQARKFVDEQIAISRRHGVAGKLSAEQKERLVRKVAQATPRTQVNGSTEKRPR